MAQVAPPTVTALPTPPSTTDIANFDADGDAFLGAFPTLRTELIALGANVYANGQDAHASAVAADASVTSAAGQVTLAAAQATLAANSASAAASTAGAVTWVSGTTYAQYAAVISPADARTYRRKTASGSGTTDPSADPTNYQVLSAGALTFQEFTSSGTWTKPVGATYVYVEGLGGGSSGYLSTGTFQNVPGGSGGSYADAMILASSLTSTVTVTIGAGGAARSTNGINSGGNTTFGGYLTAPGGGLTAVTGGGYGPGVGGTTGGSSIKAGAAGGGTDTTLTPFPPGTSVLAGNGGACATANNANGAAGAFPAGGGGAAGGTGTSGAGGNGRLRVWCW